MDIIIAVIAEFNPFHTGHARLLHLLREKFGPEATLVSLMSGAFVQRGEPAFCSKWLRARWAIQSGADCVLELPAVYALSSAAGFASGGVTLATRLGCTHLACGVERGTAAEFKRLAAISLQKDTLSTAGGPPPLLGEGVSGKRTVGQVETTWLRELAPELAFLLDAPNALLALEYVRAILRQGQVLSFVPIWRMGRHDAATPEAHFASASYLRKKLTEKGTAMDSFSSDYIPQENFSSLWQMLQLGAYTDYTRYGDFVLLAGRQLSLEDLRRLPAFTEGLENRWQRSFLAATSYQAALKAIKTRRYAFSRLRRMGAYTLLQPSRALMDSSYQAGPQYGRVLALNRRGAAFLKKAKKNFPIVSKIRKDEKRLTELGKKQLALDIKASNIQSLCLQGESQRQGQQDYYQSPQFL